MSEAGWGIVFVMSLVTAATVVLVALIWQAFATWRTRVTAGAGGARRTAAGEPAPVEGAVAGDDGAEGDR